MQASIMQSEHVVCLSKYTPHAFKSLLVTKNMCIETDQDFLMTGHTHMVYFSHAGTYMLNIQHFMCQDYLYTVKTFLIDLDVTFSYSIKQVHVPVQVFHHSLKAFFKYYTGLTLGQHQQPSEMDSNVGQTQI